MTANGLAPGRASARRIVSLVPSLTEALFALGLAERVVGATDYCVHPAQALASVPRVGGTKDPSVAKILTLRPDLVIANREENRKRTVDRIEAAGVPVWVTYPRTVQDGAALLAELATLGASAERVAAVVAPVERAVAEAEASASSNAAARQRVFCPIWRDPWMAVGPDTYADALLSLCGYANVFAHRSERRYPIVTLEEVCAADPEVIVLPDEPYAFAAADVAELQKLDVAAARDGRIHLIDGTLVSWYGPRIARAIGTLRSLLQVR